MILLPALASSIQLQAQCQCGVAAEGGELQFIFLLSDGIQQLRVISMRVIRG
jgi:hypothetical protein